MSETQEQNSPVQPSTSKQNSPVWEKAADPFPTWRKCVFAIAFITGVCGLGMRVATLPGTPDDHLSMSANITESPNGVKNAEAAANPRQTLSEQSATQSSGTQAGQAALRSSTGQASSGGLREKLDIPLGQYLDDWSGPMMQLGFSFVAGFSMGYALAFFVKATALAVGLLLFMLFGLQYAGLADVSWFGIQGYYDWFLAWIQPHAGGFQEFIANNLPASGMAALGVILGFKKK